jgi:acyl-CoA reductase-like NAD-dependent aldehyde dehydrogenase
MKNSSSTDWTAKAAQSARDTRPFIDGRRVEAVTAERFDSVNPWDGSVVARLPACAAPDADRAVAACRRAFDSGTWSGLLPTERGRLIQRFAQTVVAHAEELSLLDTLEMGMPVRQALDDIALVTSIMHDMAASVDKLTDAMTPLVAGAMSFNVREPHGVVAVISPWNFPAFVALGKLTPALLMGNSVVVKPSEMASLSTLRVADLAVEAGLPPGVLNVITGLGPQAGAALAGHADVDFLSFTGSTDTGRKIMALAGASNMKRVGLECGGKSAQIVFPSVAGDLDAVADAVAQAIFWGNGQVCVAGSRLLVHESIRDALVRRVVERASDWVSGDPLLESTTLGPLASAAQFGRVQRMVEGARLAGARVLVGGGRPDGLPTGLHYAPTVLDGVDPEFHIVQEEVFGPVLSVMTFSSTEEALTMANRNRYGLFAYVHTRDLSETLTMARGLRCGVVSVSAHRIPARAVPPVLGFEPAGESGFGIEGGLAGLQAMTRLKTVTINGA